MFLNTPAQPVILMSQCRWVRLWASDDKRGIQVAVWMGWENISPRYSWFWSRRRSSREQQCRHLIYLKLGDRGTISHTVWSGSVTRYWHHWLNHIVVLEDTGTAAVPWGSSCRVDNALCWQHNVSAIKMIGFHVSPFICTKSSISLPKRGSWKEKFI